MDEMAKGSPGTRPRRCRGAGGVTVLLPCRRASGVGAGAVGGSQPPSPKSGGKNAAFGSTGRTGSPHPGHPARHRTGHRDLRARRRRLPGAAVAVAVAAPVAPGGDGAVQGELNLVPPRRGRNAAHRGVGNKQVEGGAGEAARGQTGDGGGGAAGEEPQGRGERRGRGGACGKETGNQSQKRFWVENTLKSSSRP